MEPYNSYNPFNASTELHQLMHEEQNGERPPPVPFRSSSFPVRKNKKHPIAPLPPTPPKVYKVDPIDFRDVVQKLTGKPAHDQSHLSRMQEVAPPPLSLSQPGIESSFPSGFTGVGVEVEEKQWKSFESTFGALSPLGFSLSPSSMAVCSSILMSP